MISDTIQIDNQGNGFEKAVNETEKVAKDFQLDRKQSLHLQMMAEEMLSLARSVTGEMQASFWIEKEGPSFALNMTTKTVMDREKRSQLIFASTARKNAAASGFLGRLRDKFEQAMAAEVIHEYEEVPYSLLNDLPVAGQNDPEWDGYEASILKKVADNVEIFIRGGLVRLKVSKQF